MRLIILLLLLTGTNAVASQADVRKMTEQLLALQQRERPLLVDPEYNYLPGRSSPRPEWDHYFELENAKTGARVSPDLVGRLPMPDWYEPPQRRRRGLQMLPPVKVVPDEELPPDEEWKPAPRPGVIINPGPKRNPWD
jgi:hypothetical protein